MIAEWESRTLPLTADKFFSYLRFSPWMLPLVD